VIRYTHRLEWRKGKKGTRYGWIVWRTPDGAATVGMNNRWCVIVRHPTKKVYVLSFTSGTPPLLFATRGLAKNMAMTIYELERS